MARNEDGKETATDASETSEPTAKRLRSSPPDLTVILKYRVEPDHNDEKNSTSSSKKDGQETQQQPELEGKETIIQKEYHLYGQYLAKHSKFVDVALSLPMSEKNTRIVTFTDVTPSTFDLALSLLEDPLAARSMTVQQAVQVVEFYNKYEFGGGLKLCDHVIYEYIKRQHEYNLTTPPDDLDFLVDVIVLVERLELKKSKAIGIEYLEAKFETDGDGQKYGYHMFSLQHIRALHHLIKRGLFPATISGLTQEEVESPLFPKYFVQKWGHIQSAYFVGKMELSNTGNLVADGPYDMWENDFSIFKPPEGTVGYWCRGEAKFSIEKTKEIDHDWAIVADLYDDEGELMDDSPLVLWKCPYSRNLRYPPKGPWVACDPGARGHSPTVKHIRLNTDL